tara:strand:+ start:1025 stop:1501 length:477 start_codon:yes stop_codon:yes gene_type:complete
MKKVTTLLASLAMGWCCMTATSTAATVAGFEVADLKAGITTTNGDDPALTVGATTPIALAGVDLGLELALGVNGDDVLFDTNVTYDAFSFGAATVFATGGVGLNWLDTDSLGFDIRVGPGISYELGDGKALFATYTFGYDFDAEDTDEQFRVGVSFKF